MNRKRSKPFRPDYAVPPGETLQETLAAMGMSQAELAERLGRPKKTINEIVKGKAAITAETALQLEAVLGVPSAFWLNLEANYREALARQREQASLQKQLEWLKRLPVKAMIKQGWLPAAAAPVDQLRHVLRYFGVAGTHEWSVIWERPQVAFRRSPAFRGHPEAVAAWLRRGEIEAAGHACAPYAPAAFRRVLAELRTRTREPAEKLIPVLAERCAAAGVVVVFVPELPGTHLYGATRWLGPRKALVQLSLRGKADDHFWFTFFHEAAHVLLHGKKEVFIEARGEGFDRKDGDPKEEEANRHARDFLIPPAEFRALVEAGDFSVATLERFARRIGIAPGIVVGRLQHDKIIPFFRGNQLKQPYRLPGAEVGA